MQWNFVIFLLLIKGIVSRPPPENYDDEYEEEEEDDFFDITITCCGYKTPPLGRNRRQTDIANLQEQRLGEPSLHRRRREDITTAVCIEPRIIGGEEANPHSWPWIVALLQKKKKKKSFFCGGSLISEKFVLTAAHCFGTGHIDPKGYILKVGSHNVTEDGKEYAIKKILVHPKYRTGEFYNDVALIRVKGRVRLSDTVYPVCLPSNAKNEENPTDATNYMTIIGWGVDDTGAISRALQQVKVPTVPLEKCTEMYSTHEISSISKGITSDMLCTGYEEGGKDACQGDSGGPLMKEVRGRWFQFGIVSFGHGCAKAEFPGVFTRISRFTEWLHENTDLSH